MVGPKLRASSSTAVPTVPRSTVSSPLGKKKREENSCAEVAWCCKQILVSSLRALHLPHFGLPGERSDLMHIVGRPVLSESTSPAELCARPRMTMIVVDPW